MEDFCDGWHGRYNGISIKIQFTIVGGGGRAGGKDSGREEARPASTAQLQRCSKVVQRACVSAMCRSTSFVARVIYRGRGR